MSQIAWIDFDQDDREWVNGILELFHTENARDELGLGTIRDTLSDMMFPGTSAIQTRLRYMLFVPWIYQRAIKSKSSNPEHYARNLEIRLITSLETGNEKKGVIGRTVHGKLKRLPSEIYWSGIRRLGILAVRGSRGKIANTECSPYTWASNFPEEPPGFLSKTNFDLTKKEACFFCDQLENLANSEHFHLWHELAQSGTHEECDQIWLHPNRGDWSGENCDIVDNVENFALTMHGAALLYNMMLAQKQSFLKITSAKNLITEYRGKLDKWTAGNPVKRVKNWDREKFMNLIKYRRLLNPSTECFVHEWCDMVLRSDGNVEAYSEARNLIEKREHMLKGSRARLRNEDALRRWGGSSGEGLLNFRWNVVISHLKDICDAK